MKRNHWVYSPHDPRASVSSTECLIILNFPDFEENTPKLHYCDRAKVTVFLNSEKHNDIATKGDGSLTKLEWLQLFFLRNKYLKDNTELHHTHLNLLGECLKHEEG